MRELTRHVNKGLLAVANRAIISHTIDRIDPSVTIVVAIGYQGALVRQYLALAYPDRTFIFVEVDPYEGEGSGLGYTLLCCKKHLQMPFIFCACDTLVESPIPVPDENWVGYATTKAGEAYRSVLAYGGSLTMIREKGEYPEKPALIGLCGIKDYREFWFCMESPKAVAEGEAYGLNGIASLGIKAREFCWYDTGTPELLEKANRRMNDGGPTILPKPNELIWFANGRVIKWSTDKAFIANRVKRAEILQPCVPKIEGSTENMYAYGYAKGRVLSEIVTPDLTLDLLHWLHAMLWKRVECDRATFRKQCEQFYRDKTFGRVEEYLAKKPQYRGPQRVNGVPVQGITTLLSKVPWDYLSDGIPVNWHGDLHFENIVHNEENDAFVLLDWRQDFQGELTYGDLGYDLAKLLHGLIVCHTLIGKNLYWFESKRDGQTIEFELLRRHVLVQCEKVFWRFVETMGVDRFRVELLTALIFLNIAPLHHDPYSDLLYHLGKSMLDSVLAEEGR